jgi:hypothetical protein
MNQHLQFDMELLLSPVAHQSIYAFPQISYVAARLVSLASHASEEHTYNLEMHPWTAKGYEA